MDSTCLEEHGTSLGKLVRPLSGDRLWVRFLDFFTGNNGIGKDSCHHVTNTHGVRIFVVFKTYRPRRCVCRTGNSTRSSLGQVLLSKQEDLIAMMSSLWDRAKSVFTYSVISLLSDVFRLSKVESSTDTSTRFSSSSFSYYNTANSGIVCSLSSSHSTTDAPAFFF